MSEEEHQSEETVDAATAVPQQGDDKKSSWSKLEIGVLITHALLFLCILAELILGFKSDTVFAEITSEIGPAVILLSVAALILDIALLMPRSPKFVTTVNDQGHVETTMVLRAQRGPATGILIVIPVIALFLTMTLSLTNTVYSAM